MKYSLKNDISIMTSLRIDKAGLWKRKPKPVPPPSAAASDLPGTNKIKGLPTLKKLFFDRFMAMASILKCTRVLWPASLSHNLVLKVAICHRMLLPFMKLWTNLLNMFKLMIRQRNLMPRVRTLIMRDLNTKSPIFVQSNVRVIPLYSLFHGRPHRSENAFSRVHQSEPSNGPEQWSLETHIMVRAIRVARRVMPRMNRGRWLTKSYFLSISVLHSQKYDGLYCYFTSYSQVT